MGKGDETGDENSKLSHTAPIQKLIAQERRKYKKVKRARKMPKADQAAIPADPEQDAVDDIIVTSIPVRRKNKCIVM